MDTINNQQVYDVINHIIYRQNKSKKFYNPFKICNFKHGHFNFPNVQTIRKFHNKPHNYATKRKFHYFMLLYYKN